ncbi:hypothetical protein GIB67_018796 [Kingdonia uniflora]|uniref:Gamma-butyrobetaine hydroxylase-like N-terminal domain-containing protein n=1 Tax=Kingdonia uniflora TaxID=39325 RepID=A0A7J7NEF1_9MAGN|nr:hypothetical protein GIB67_018796 [Kingdonia uniflora]
MIGEKEKNNNKGKSFFCTTSLVPHHYNAHLCPKLAPSLQVNMYALKRAIHVIHASVQPPRLTKFSLIPPKNVEVEFADGNVFNLSAEFLRVYSPAVDSKIRSVGGEKVIFGRCHVGIMSAEPVGNYGIRILFDDLHKTGIYTWDYFYHLGSNKFTLMRNYIKTLKKHGLSRQPRRSQ